MCLLLNNPLNLSSRPAWLFGSILTGMLAFGAFKASAQCDSHPLTVPESFLGDDYTGNGDFSLLVFGNYNATNASAVLQGKAAIGGNFTFGHDTDPFSVGTGLDESLNSDNFIVNGTYTNHGAAPVTVRGNFRYRSNSGTPLPVHDPGEGDNSSFTGDILDFDGLKSYFISASNDYAAQSPTPGASSALSGGVLTLTGTGAVQEYVFTLDAGGESISTVSFINIPEGSTIKLNLLGEIVTFTAGTFPDTHKENLLINFPEATQIILAGLPLNGSVLAPLANLQITGNSSVNGKVVVGENGAQQSGSFTFNDPCLPNNTMPVTLSDFRGYREASAYVLGWSTAAEVNFEEFEIQQSADGYQWVPVGTIPARGKDTGGSRYSFTVASIASGRYFRLKMIDHDGSYSSSGIIAFAPDREPAGIFPNPSRDRVYFNAGDAALKIVNSVGQLVYCSPGQTTGLDIQSWPSGIYFVELVYPDGRRETARLVRK